MSVVAAHVEIRSDRRRAHLPHQIAAGVLVWATAAAGALISSEAAIPISPGDNALQAASTVPMLLVILAASYLAAGGHLRRQVAASVGAWMIFVSVASVTTAWSVDPSETIGGVIALTFLVVFLAALTAAEVPPRLLATLERAILLGGVVAAMWGIVGFLTGTIPAGQSGIPRFSAVGAPNATAAALLLPFLIALARAVSAPATSARSRPHPRGHRAVYGAAAAVVLIGILITGSRGGLVSAGCGMVALALLSGQRRRVLGIAAVLVAATAATFLAAPSTLQDRLTASHSTGRTGLWSLALEACEEHCLLGSGYGTFPQIYGETFRQSPHASGYHSADFKAHNIWLEAAVETGLVGLLALIFAVWVTVAVGLRAPPHLRVVAVPALVAVLTANLFLSHLPFRYFWLVIVYATLCGSSAHPASGGSARR